SMEIDSQNLVFDAFYKRLVEHIDLLAALGGLDVGVETWRTPPGGRLEKVSEKTVHIDKRTGAETKLVTLREIAPTRFNQFENYAQRAFYVNVASGKVWAASGNEITQTTADGQVIRLRNLIGPRSTNQVEVQKLNDPERYLPVSREEAKKLWEQEIAQAPQVTERTLHFITGVVLPIWDRLKGNPKVFRLQTIEGERLLGRLVQQKHLGQIMRNLGVVEAVKASPEELFREVLQNDKVLRLANDWTISRRRVAGEYRIELQGPEYQDRSALFDAGVFSTVIDYRTRYFIPTDQAGVDVLKRLVELKGPVVAVTEKETRQFRMARTSAQEPAPTREGSVVTQAMVEAAFPGLEVRRARLFDGYRVLLPHSGMEIAVLLNGDILLPDAESLRKAGYSDRDIADIQRNADTMMVAGEWRIIHAGGIITLAKGLTTPEAAGTLRHEAFHAACDLVLSDKERHAILQKFGDWETAARAYETWTPQHRPDTLFQKILDFFRRIYEAFRPTYAGVFEKIHRGEVWGRQPREAGVLGEPKYSLRPQDQATIKTYRDSYLAPTEPQEPRNVTATAKDVKESLLQKAQRFYDQVVDKWAAWERLAERAAMAGARVPQGEHITNALSFMRGVEGRVRQGLTGEYVYQDKKAYDVTLGQGVFVGDELVRKGASFKRRLEPLREMARRRGVDAAEVMDDFEVLLVAQRDLELAGEFGNREAGEIKGVHPEESKEVIAALRRKYGNEDFRELNQVAGSLREWSDEMILQPLRQVGFIDEVTYLTIKAKNQFYVPFMRLLEQTNDYIAAHLGSEGVRGRVLHKIKGSEKQILSPLQTWIELAYKAQWAYARNKVYRAAYLIGRVYEDADVYEVPAKYVPVDFKQKQEIDSSLRKELLDLARKLKVDVKMVRSMRGRRLGEFSQQLKEEVSEGLLPEEVAGQIRVRFATTEKTLAHNLGHALDAQYDLVDLLITRGTREMRQELRRIADQRASQADSKYYKRFVRKRPEQVAEFVNRYITDRATARAVAPETTAVFEKLLNQDPRLKPLLTFKPTAQARLLEFQNRVWARSPLPPEPGCVPYYRDGHRRWLKLPPDLYHAAQNLMPSEMGILMQLARIPADLLKSGAILVPEFSLGRNPVRDIIQAWIFSRFGFNPLKWFRDAALFIGKDEATLEYRRQWEAGGGVLSTLAESFVEPQKLSADYLKGKEGKVKYFANPLHALRYATAYLENLTRFSIYKQARERGLSHAEAIHEARRTTLDYSRAGGHPTARYLNMLIPFWNAAVQGMDKLVTELTGPNRKAVARRLAGLATFSILVFLFAHRDERYKELEDWERNYFWHLPLGPDAPLLRIPKPFEAGILFGSVFERLTEAWITRDVKGVKSALAAAWDAATPEVIPTIARPYVEAKANYDFFRRRPIEDLGLKQLPPGLRAKPWTTETAKAIGRLTDISPVQLEHFIRSWTGGLGANYFFPGLDLVLRKTGVVEDLTAPEVEAIQKVWGVRTFFTRNPTGWRAKSVNDFFERYQEVLQADQGWKLLWQSGDIGRMEKFLEEHPEARYARVARKLMDDLSKVKKERNRIYASKTLAAPEKRGRLEALDEQVVEIAKLGAAFMSPEAAAEVGMPSIYRTELGVRRRMSPEDYYEMVAQQTYEAFKAFRERAARLEALGSRERADYVARLLRQTAREHQFKPKKPRREELFPLGAGQGGPYE
ncbi:MAG: hypothetical protein K6T55_12625, partial [Syntrophobacterales bacterium]|nr:hypothetical protein [Syntrophobacterales bacterium]